MKKQILMLAIAATTIGSIAVGCSSTNEATGTDSVSTTTVVSDSTSNMSSPATDTTKMDTNKKM